MSSIGARIKEYRLLRGMTQQEIADALGESSGRVIYHWEKGSGRPDCDKLDKLCDLLGVSADELIGCKVMHHRPTIRSAASVSASILPWCCCDHYSSAYWNS